MLNFIARLFTVFVLFASQSSFASITVMGTRVIYDASMREVTVQTRNTAVTPLVLQAWIDDGDEKQTPDKIKVPFLVNPPLTRVEAKKGQAIRLKYVANMGEPLPTDRESVFYLNVMGIPPALEEDAGKNMLKLTLRSRLKLFFRPKNLPGHVQDAAQTVRWRLVQEKGQSFLEADNPSAFHVSLNKLSLPLADKIVVATPDMIAPFSQRRFLLEQAVPAGQGMKLQWEWINDSGGVQAIDSTVTTGAP